MWIMLASIFSAAIALPALIIVALAALAHYTRTYKFARRTASNKCTVSFFHPYCNSGGGGERVLWCAIDHLLKYQDPSVYEFVVYSGDSIDREEMLQAARKRFGLALADNTDNLRIVHITSRGLLEAARCAGGSV
jgi:alpha-1,2-mannosyltransferase